jgi:hypothetical protein
MWSRGRFELPGFGSEHLSDNVMYTLPNQEDNILEMQNLMRNSTHIMSACSCVTTPWQGSAASGPGHVPPTISALAAWFVPGSLSKLKESCQQMLHNILDTETTWRTQKQACNCCVLPPVRLWSVDCWVARSETWMLLAFRFPSDLVEHDPGRLDSWTAWQVQGSTRGNCSHWGTIKAKEKICVEVCPPALLLSSLQGKFKSNQ